MAGASSDAALCAICRDALSEEPTEAMTCGHVFHTFCLHKYAEVQHLPLHQLPCAICKQVAQTSPGMSSFALQAIQFPPATGDVGELQPAGSVPHGQENAAGDGVTIELSDPEGEWEPVQAAAPDGAVGQAMVQAEQAVVQPRDAAEQAVVQPRGAAEQADGQPRAAAGPTPAVQPRAADEQADGQPGAAAGPTPAGQPPAAAGPLQVNRNASVQDVGLFPDPTVLCSTCGGFAVLSKMRLASKGAGTWECRTCMVKIVTLRREFGKWPITQFATMSLAEKQAFMKDIAGKNISEIRAIIETKFRKIAQHGTYYDYEGEFLPLSVWQTRGYDVELIRTMAPSSDRKMHPFLGELFRIVTIKTGQKGYEGTENSEEMSKRPKKALQDLGLAAPPATTAASSADGGGESNAAPKLSDDGPTSSSNDTSSSSSSSSSEKKKKKEEAQEE